MTVKFARAYHLFQGFSGLLFILFGFAFPVYIYNKYGFSYGDLYDQVGHVVGQVRYIWVGLGFGCMALVMGTIQLRMAKSHLDKDR